MVVKELFAKMGISVDLASFMKAEFAVHAIEHGLETLGEKLKEAAAEFVELFTGTAEFAKEIEEMSARTGISTEALQELRFAAKMSGVGLEELAQGIKFLGVNMSKAADGSTEIGAAFKKLGVSVKDGDGRLKGMDEMLGDVADGFTKVEDPARRSQLAVEIFGKSGAALIPFLRKGKDGIAELRQEAHDLGLVLTEEEIKDGAEFHDGLTKISFAAEGLRNIIAGPLMKSLADLAKEYVNWIEKNREVLKQRIHDWIERLKPILKATVWLVKTLATEIGVLVNHLGLLATLLLGRLLVALATNFVSVAMVTAMYVGMGIAATQAGWAAFVAGIKAQAPWLPFLIVGGLVLAFFQDLYTSIRYGDGILADFWDAIWNSDAMYAIRTFFSDIGKWLSSTWETLGGFKGIWDTTIAFWKTAIGTFFDWFASGFRSMVAKIPGGQWLLSKIGSQGASPTVPGSAPAPQGSLPGAAPSAEPLFGGGAVSPAASASVNQSSVQANRSVLFQPNINAPITITGVDDPKAAAAAASNHIEDATTRMYREAYQAVGR